MQQLELKTTIPIIEMPNVEANMLSEIGDFQEKVSQFQDKWNINLEFNENARWRPGSYERLKQQVVDALFPQWQKPKGANNISKLTNFNRWNASELRKDSMEIDRFLKTFRMNKTSLNPDKLEEEGLRYLKLFSESIILPKNVNFNCKIQPIPYFTRYRRWETQGNVRHLLGIINADKPLKPLLPEIPDIYNNNITKLPSMFDDLWKRKNISIHFPDGFANFIQPEYEARLKSFSKNTNPKRWWFNMEFDLIDVHLDCDYGGTIKETLPYGHLKVCFSIPLYDMIKSFKINTDDNSHPHRVTTDTKWWSQHTYKFPYLRGLEHPFVYNGLDEAWNSYAYGNTCFGDFRDDITVAMTTGNFNLVAILLEQWSKTYMLGHTTPLNRLEHCHIGMPFEWLPENRKDNFELTNYISTDPRKCKRVVNQGFDKEQFIDKYCSNCALKDRDEGCVVYKDFTKVQYNFELPLFKHVNQAFDSYPHNIWNKKVTKDKVMIEIVHLTNWHINNVVNHPGWIQYSNRLQLDGFGDGGFDFETLKSYFNRIDNTLYNIKPTSTLPKIHWEDIIHSYLDIIYMSERIGLYHVICELNPNTYDYLQNKFRYTSIKDAEKSMPLADLRAMVYTYSLEQGRDSLMPHIHHLRALRRNQGDNGPALAIENEPTPPIEPEDRVSFDTNESWLNLNEQESEDIAF